jgi:pimeloyl-ACP methyl ester carboxylesterase
MIDIQTANARIAVEVTGQGEPLLFIPGFPLDHRMWSAQIDHFSRSFQVLAPDLRGYGGSSAQVTPVTMHDLAGDLIQMLDQLAPNQSVTVCGLSMGGYIAWQLVHHWPQRVERLVLCHTRSAADSPETARGRRLAMEGIRQSGSDAFLSAMLERLLAPQTKKQSPTLVAKVRKWMDEAAAESLVRTLDALAQRPDATPWLAAIDCPCLVIAGSEDPITPATEMREMAEQIRGAEFVLLDGVGHLSPCESPDRFNAALEAFMLQS